MKPVNERTPRFAAWAAWAATVLLLLALTGCVETKVELHLEADGSGTRHVEMAWQEEALDDLELDDTEIRELLGLDPEQGWEMRREARPVGDGKPEPHVVYSRTAQIRALDAWPAAGADLRMRAHVDHPERMADEIEVEVGRGAGYRTLSYRERLDGASIRALLDRMAAGYLVERLASDRPGLDTAERAEMRGILVGHLGYHDVWSLDDEIADEAWLAFADAAAPQLAKLIDADRASARTRLDEVFEQGEINDWLEDRLPGISLLATMNLKVEIVVPGVVVETTADRSGEGYAAWERPAWDALTVPVEFAVRVRIED